MVRGLRKFLLPGLIGILLFLVGCQKKSNTEGGPVTDATAIAQSMSREEQLERTVEEKKNQLAQHISDAVPHLTEFLHCQIANENIVNELISLEAEIKSAQKFLNSVGKDFPDLSDLRIKKSQVIRDDFKRYRDLKKMEFGEFIERLKVKLEEEADPNRRDQISNLLTLIQAKDPNSPEEYVILQFSHAEDAVELIAKRYEKQETFYEEMLRLVDSVPEELMQKIATAEAAKKAHLERYSQEFDTLKRLENEAIGRGKIIQTLTEEIRVLESKKVL